MSGCPSKCRLHPCPVCCDSRCGVKRARAEQVEREAAADELSQMTQDNDLDDDDWRADGYDDLRGGYYG